MPFWKPPESRRWAEWKPWRQCGNWVCNVHTILTPKSTQKPPESWRWAQWKPPEMVRQLGLQCGNWVCIPATYQPRPSTTPPLPSLSAMQSLICILHCRAKLGCLVCAKSAQLFMSNGLDIVHLHGWEIQSSFVCLCFQCLVCFVLLLDSLLCVDLEVLLYFNFLAYNIIQCLIWKLSLIVNLSKKN